MTLNELSMEGLCAELASGSPAPGGGSAAALSGALAASLCAMVCRITLGKESRKEAWPEMERSLVQAESLGSKLRALVSADAEAFMAVMAARALPKSSEPEREKRSGAVRAATLRCARVPLQTLEALAALVSVVESVFSRGEPACRTDSASAAVLARAAALAADYNVRVNLPGIPEPETRGEIATRSAGLLASMCRTTDRIEKEMDNSLNEGSRP